MAEKQYFSSDEKMQFYLNDFKNVLPLKNKAQTVIVDPPYNIGFNYGTNFKDNKDQSEYKEEMKALLNLSYKSSKPTSSMFFINYPEIIGMLYETINQSPWKIHQWISWVYPANIGQSKNKFTTAQRAILWLVKQETTNQKDSRTGRIKKTTIKPKVHIKRVYQDYKNPTDKRVRELIKNGSKGANLYNWWEINLVKNVSKDKKLYVNQIPREVLNRLILTTTDKNDVVLDPMCGTGSALVAAADLGRKGVGSDLNKDLVKIWKESIKDLDSKLNLDL
jgi:DNA modification methylase